MNYEILAAMVWYWLRDRNGNTFYHAGVKRLEWIARPEREAPRKILSVQLRLFKLFAKTLSNT